MNPRTIGKVEDYTDAFLVSLGVFMFVAFWVIAAAFGWVWLAVTSYAIDQSFQWLGRRRAD